MNFRALIEALKLRILANKRLQPIAIQKENNDFSFRSKYQQRRISNRIFK